jgi:uncharacterized protein (DUF1697 family)
MTYVALLRGINVGGHKTVSMVELKRVFEQAGMEAVSTYINSGNVIFQSSLPTKTEIARVLEEAIETAFGFGVKIVVCDKDSILALAKALPDTWVNDASMKCDVMFLWENIDQPQILKQLAIKPEIDSVKYVQGALLWSVDRKNVTKSGMLKLVGTDLYKQMTIRNCNTLRKLALLVN